MTSTDDRLSHASAVAGNVRRHAAGVPAYGLLRSHQCDQIIRAPPRAGLFFDPRATRRLLHFSKITSNCVPRLDISAYLASPRCAIIEGIPLPLPRRSRAEILPGGGCALPRAPERPPFSRVSSARSVPVRIHCNTVAGTRSPALEPTFARPDQPTCPHFQRLFG